MKKINLINLSTAIIFFFAFVFVSGCNQNSSNSDGLFALLAAGPGSGEGDSSLSGDTSTDVSTGTDAVSDSSTDTNTGTDTGTASGTDSGTGTGAESTLPELHYSTNHIEIYMTNPLSDPQGDDAIIDLVDHAKAGESLDLCLYGLDRENLIVAIENAIDRGVHVRFVGDRDGSDTVEEMEGDYYEGYYRIASKLDTAFPVSGKQRIHFPDDDGFTDFRLINSNAIQHNKFGIIRHTNGKEYLFTGTTNMTETGFERNNNNLILFQDAGIAATYRQQFEYLLGIASATQVTTVNTHTIDGIEINVLFSPQNLDGLSAMDHLMDLVESADSSIHFLIFSFPHRYLNDLVVAKALDEGLDVKGVFDQSQLNNHAEEYYAQQEIPVRIDGNYNVLAGHGGKLHHKTMILDSAQNDAVVVTGSFNWSDNANENNDENMIFIHSKAIAQFYEQEFERRFTEGTTVSTQTAGDQAVAGDVIINEVMWPGRRNAGGTSSYNDYTDEFIELKNTTSSRIDLSGWAIRGGAMSGKPIVLSGGTYIDANSLLVLQHHWPEDSAWSPAKYRVEENVSLANGELYLVLEDPDRTLIDVAAGKGIDPATFAGSNDTPKRSMARFDDIGDGTRACNWFTTTTQQNINSGYLTYNFATPGAENGGGANGCGGNPGDSDGSTGATTVVAAGDLILNEIGNKVGGITENDFLEIYNTTGSSIDMTGMYVARYTGTKCTAIGAGTATTATNWIDLTGYNLAANEYFTIARDGNTLSGIDLSTTSLTSIASNECMALLKAQTDIDSPSHEDVIDFVGWGSSSAFEGTAATNVADSSALSRCPDGTDSDNNSGDFSPAGESPGAENLCAASLFTSGFESGDDTLTLTTSGSVSQGESGCTEYGNYRTGTGGFTITTITTSYTGRDAETGCLALNHLSSPVDVAYYMIADPANGGNELRGRVNVEWYTDSGCLSAHATAAEQSTAIVINEGIYTRVSGSFTPPDATATHMKVSVQMKDDNGGTNGGDNFCLDDLSINN